MDLFSNQVDALAQPLTLPCGAVLKNRLAKAAMTEGLADTHNRATDRHLQLYSRWAKNGFGLMLTGNVQADRRHLERPSNIAVDNNGGFDKLRELAALGTRDGAQFWMQINHAGRQTPAAINPEPIAPSAIPLPMAEAGCGNPRAITKDEIHDVHRRFSHVSEIARECGFTGVQIHGAHGYLSSQFLSPLSNTREDEWGGSLENRARFLLQSVRSVRAAVGSDFPISVKLNSADFQRGGFDFEESMQVVRWLEEAGVDLLEISGGNYEQMQMVGLGNEQSTQGGSNRPKAESTREREAYFLDYARSLRPQTAMPIMITGGMRSAETINSVLAENICDVAGIGRPICTHPDDQIEQLLAGSLKELPALERGLALAPGALGPDINAATFKRIESFGLLGWYCLQLLQMGDGGEPELERSVFDALNQYKDNEERAAAAWQPPGAE